jgi:hypothetical protein
MNRKRILFILLAAVAGLLAACSGSVPGPTPGSVGEPAEAPTTVPTIEAEVAAPTPVPPDPITIAQSFYEALNAHDVDTAAAFLADGVVWRGVPTLTGKASVQTYLEATDEGGWTNEITDFRATNGRVTYTVASSLNGNLQVSGEETMVVENGMITAIESYAVLGSDVRPDISEVSFTAADYTFSGPDEIAEGWVKFVLTNEGPQPHHIQLVKLDEGKTVDDLKTALAAEPEIYPAWARVYGGPNAPDPGGTTSAIVFLDAGNYAVICIIPDAEGTPHVQHGMMKALTVTESRGPIAGEPKADVLIDLADFAFTVPTSVTAGEHLIRFSNTGRQIHEAVLVKLTEGTTAEAYLNAPLDAPPPGISYGGIAGIEPGNGQYINVDFEPGNYALFCFLPDPETHAPHFVQGMVQEFTVR